MTRRDRCFLLGRRMQKLTPDQAAKAWQLLGEKVEAMGELDLPKFANIATAMHDANQQARK